MSRAESEEKVGTAQTHQDSTDGVNLLEGEFVLENRHPHWVNWPISLTVAALFALGALGSAASGDVGSLITSLVIAGLLFGYVYYSRQQSRYVVTNQRVIKKVGLLRRSTGETRITDIRSLQTKQGILERPIGRGSVQIDSTGTGGLLGIDGVDDYQSLANTIRTQQQQLDS